ncbi:MAG TPA: magnesium transporter [Firmicutes bacterium]|jgi:magnesium transporter|nr:magnesium transporter [Bacillota bacterium]
MKQKILSLAEIKRLVEDRNWSLLRRELAVMRPPEIADLLLELEKADRILVFRLLPRELSSEAFSYLDGDHQDALAGELTSEEMRRLLADMKPDDRTQFLAELPGQVTQRLLNYLSPADLIEARHLLGYPEESVGRLMTPDYVAVRPEWTVAQAIEHIRHKGKDSETINVVYVTDSSWKLLDALELRRFILAKPTDRVEQLMNHFYVTISAMEDREEAVRMMHRHALSVLPVVDSAGVLLGIVTVDDVLDVAEEEITEDFHKAAAVRPLKSGYREAGVWPLYRKRIGWLVILILINLVSSTVISIYEDVLASAMVLTFFIPLLIASGGNVGSQSATLMIRALATGDVKLTQWFRVLSKELLVGLAIGATMGLAGGLLGLFQGGYQIGVVVGLAMVAVVLVSNIMGVALPFVLLRVGLDPAVASSPLITSIADATGLAIYFAIAVWFLGG